MSIASYLSQLLNASGLITGSKIASSTIGLSNLSATGTPSASNFLRGDNTWAAVSAGTVTSVATGSGLTGGPITSSGTISLDVYTGSTVNNQTYPVGTTVLVTGISSININGSTAVWSPPAVGGSQFNMTNPGGAGTVSLTGTWRNRGLAYSVSVCSTVYYTFLVQRVA